MNINYNSADIDDWIVANVTGSGIEFGSAPGKSDGDAQRGCQRGDPNP